MSLNEGTFVKPLNAEGMEKVVFIFLLYKKGSLSEDGYASLRFSFQIKLSGVRCNQ